MNIEEIKEYWEQVQSQTLKQRLKLYRTVVFRAAKFGNQENIKVEDLKYCLDIIKVCILHLTDPQSAQRQFNKLTVKYLDLLGVIASDIKIILKKSGKVDLKTALITIKDTSYQDDFDINKDESKELLRLFNQGKWFTFGTGADGLYDVQLRIVDSPIPVLSPKEFLYSCGSTPNQIIHFPTGNVIISDSSGTYDSHLTIQIPPGNYVVCTYSFVILRKDFFSYYIVLCKTDEMPSSEFYEVPELELLGP